MKRVMLGVVLVLGVMGLSGAATAQDAVKPQTRFYNFDELLIDGELKAPPGVVYGAVDRAKFERLLSLKRSFLPQIAETARGEALQ